MWNFVNISFEPLIESNVDIIWVNIINFFHKPLNKNLVYETYESGAAESLSGADNEKKQCHWPWSGIVINWDGGVNPCCIIDDPKSDFANINNKTIKEVWNSDEYISSRSEFGDGKEIIKNTICNICKNQTHSKRLNRVSKTFAIKI